LESWWALGTFGCFEEKRREEKRREEKRREEKRREEKKPLSLPAVEPQLV